MNSIKYLIPLTLVALSACGGGSGSDSEPEEINVAPVGVDDVANVVNGSATTIDVLTNDSDINGDSLIIDSVGEATQGEVVITNNAVVYTPTDTSFAGTDSFTYTLSDGELTAQATVNIELTQELTFAGKVTDNDIPNATVTIEIGEQTFTVEADENGVYSLPVTINDSSAFITIQAVGSEQNQQSYIEFVSIAGSVSGLLESAGDDRTLSSEEDFSTNVTNVTTAKYVLVLEANNGEAVSSSEELAEAEKSVDSDALIEIAAAIKLIVDNQEYSLPEGTESILEFVNDEEAYNNFVEEVTGENPESNPLTEAMDEIVNDEDLVQAASESMLPSRYYVIADSVPGFLARGGTAYDFAQDGTGRYVHGEGTIETSWNINVDGYFEVDYVSPRTWELWDQVENITEDQNIIDAHYSAFGYGNVTRIQSESSIRFKIINDGELVDSVTGVRERVISAYSFDFEGQTYTIPAETLSFDFNSEFRDGDVLETSAFDNDLVIGSWGMEVFYPDSKGDLVTFNANNTGVASISGLEFEWAIDEDGQLAMSYADGTTQTISILDTVEPNYGFYSEVLTPSGNLLGSYEFAIKQSLTDFNEADLVNSTDQFWTTMVNAWNPSLWENGDIRFEQLWGWKIESGSAMANLAFYLWDNDGDGTDERNLNQRSFTWTEEDDGSFSFNGSYWGCASPEDLCHTRNWIPLDASEDYIYLVEQAWSNDELYFEPRVNIYKRHGIPATDSVWNPSSPSKVAPSKSEVAARQIVYPSKGSSANR